MMCAIWEWNFSRRTQPWSVRLIFWLLSLCHPSVTIMWGTVHHWGLMNSVVLCSNTVIENIQPFRVVGLYILPALKKDMHIDHVISKPHQHNHARHCNSLRRMHTDFRCIKHNIKISISYGHIVLHLVLHLLWKHWLKSWKNILWSDCS